MRRLSQLSLVVLAALLFVATPAHALPITLVGQPGVVVQLLDNGVGLPDPLQDIVTPVSPGAEISHPAVPDGTNIGGQAMLTGEFINIEATSVVFGLYGGSGVAASSGGFTTGYGTNARYVLSNLFDPLVAEIVGVNLTPLGVTGVTTGTQLLFDAHSLTLYLDTLGITPDTNLGTLRVDLTVRALQTEPPPGNPGDNPAVPEPASLLLLGSGISALGVKYRRRRHPRT